jgi:hypothetical protein
LVRVVGFIIKNLMVDCSNAVRDDWRKTRAWQRFQPLGCRECGLQLGEIGRALYLACPL